MSDFNVFFILFYIFSIFYSEHIKPIKINFYFKNH